MLRDRYVVLARRRSNLWPLHSGRLQTICGPPESPMISSIDPAPALAYARAHRRRFVAELCDLLRFPSVTSAPRSDAMRRCSSCLATHLGHVGLEGVSLLDTPAPPVVHACWRRAPRSPTILVYGHYDVQPPEPLDAWTSP